MVAGSARRGDDRLCAEHGRHGSRALRRVSDRWSLRLLKITSAVREARWVREIGSGGGGRLASGGRGRSGRRPRQSPEVASQASFGVALREGGVLPALWCGVDSTLGRSGAWRVILQWFPKGALVRRALPEGRSPVQALQRPEGPTGGSIALGLS